MTYVANGEISEMKIAEGIGAPVPQWEWMGKCQS